jgi:hypothetical protein
MNALESPHHELVGMLNPNPEYDSLLLAAPGDSYVRRLWGYRVGHYYPVEPSAVSVPTLVEKLHALTRPGWGVPPTGHVHVITDKALPSHPEGNHQT